MIELYLLEQAIRAERELLDHESARRAAVLERLAGVAPGGLLRVRRQLALLLLALADRLDPRPVLSTRHGASRPALNGRLHHA
jgi:hypothetical protein